jgi:hypothetical protein
VHELLSRVPGQLSSVVLELSQLLPQLISLKIQRTNSEGDKGVIVNKTNIYCSNIDFLFLSKKFVNSFIRLGTVPVLAKSKKYINDPVPLMLFSAVK